MELEMQVHTGKDENLSGKWCWQVINRRFASIFLMT